MQAKQHFQLGLRKFITPSMDIRSRKVLIADDEPDILEILKYNLLKEGYQVVTAKDGDEAIEKAKMFNPDLIVLDIMMPKKNGVEVCEILRLLPAFKSTLILFLTALSDETIYIHPVFFSFSFLCFFWSKSKRSNAETRTQPRAFS